MSKRFTDTDIWNAPWHRRLSPAAKLFWRWLVDNCDHAGVIEADVELASFQIGEDVSGAFDELGGRVEEFGEGLILVPKFIGFQYGEPSEECRAHGPIFKSLRRHGLEFDVETQRVSKGYPKGINTHKEKEKDKDKEKEKDKTRARDPIQLRINALFNRRESTKWSEKERRTYSKLWPIPEQDIAAIEKYYRTDCTCLRRDIGTLLNNWTGELDRAANYKNGSETKPKKFEGKGAPPKIPAMPKDFPAFLKADGIPGDPRGAWVVKTLRDDYENWKTQPEKTK